MNDESTYKHKKYWCAEVESYLSQKARNPPSSISIFIEPAPRLSPDQQYLNGAELVQFISARIQL